MSRNWRGWLRSSTPEHTTKEVEHRFTELEIFTAANTDDLRGVRDKLLSHERAIIGLTMAVSALAQEQFPHLASMLKQSLNLN